MSETPYFSIVIPTYNREKFIISTIHSLLKQDFASFEILVIDDGSTDNTEQAVKGIGDARVTYFKKENAERGAARNYGAGRAKGQYVNFFDSDDLAYSHHLSHARKAIDQLKNPEVLHLGYDIKDDQGAMIRVVDRWPATINRTLINGNHLSCNGVFIRTDITQQLRFSEIRDLSASEDYELWLRLAARFPFHCVDGVTSTVVNHESRSVLKINHDKFLKRFEVLEAELMKDETFVKAYRSDLGIFRAYTGIYIALHLAMSNHSVSESLGFLKKAFVERPSVVFTKRFLAVFKVLALR